MGHQPWSCALLALAKLWRGGLKKAQKDKSLCKKIPTPSQNTIAGRVTLALYPAMNGVPPPARVQEKVVHQFMHTLTQLANHFWQMVYSCRPFEVKTING